MQFYVFWPLLVFLVPRKSLGWVFVGCALLASVSRLLIERWVPGIHHGEAITTSALDYFGVGAWLALALDGGLKAGDRRFSVVAWCAFAGYLALYVFDELGRQVPGLWPLKQTLLSVAFAGFISATLGGLGGVPGRILDHPAVQHVGRLSYGLYLFHTPVPLLLGLLLPQLWLPVFSGPLLGLRLAVFGLSSWGLAWLCWRWLEGPDRLGFPRLAGKRR